MTALPDWLIPPEEGWTAEDLDRLPPEAPRHLELIHGDLLLTMTPQKAFHARVLQMLEAALVAACPDNMIVRREMTTRIDRWNRPEPDLMVLEGAGGDGSETWYPVESVRLAVEVISPESQGRDTRAKPGLYADAGIPSFWIVDRVDDVVAVESFELAPPDTTGAGRYVSQGVSTGSMTVTLPFPVTIDLTALPR
jgi:Uma2 family endonuclease